MTVQKEKVTRRIVCRKCKSDQVVGNKRGYNFRRVFSYLFCLFAILIGVPPAFRNWLAGPLIFILSHFPQNSVVWLSEKC
ncbi:hypothetical protein BF28_5632 (plasmid) [Bacillus cereus E33L]|uniref:Uncharacterized protein n=1 Tax=Bacillus cereus (strain ZK / E33L) TaxID=288681 RepID=Q4V1T8_BACCZ|nr:hypothetical protein pE33L466_0159 [Bacillus cereus E33L]AJI26122.1 hypothetical protein BF28_5632 [Bacillus cereus E33L]